MTVNYTTNLSLGQPVTGTESGTWGDDVNNAVTSYLDIAIAGGLAITITTTDVTLSITQGTSVATNIGSTTAQYAILNVSGAMTAARNLIVPSSSRIYLINNNTTGGFALTVKGSATSGVTLVNGEKAHVFWNGTDYAKLSNASGGAGVFSSITNSGLTSGRVVYSTSGGLETDSAGLTFDGTNFATTGTATAAKLIPTGTSVTGNGMYLPAANSLGLSTNGTNAVYIDSTQNVGIGTSSPSTYGKFVVSSGGVVGTFIGNASLTGSAPTYQGSIRLIDNPTSSTTAAGGIEFLTSTFGSGYGWKMAAIDSSGVQLTFATRQNSATWSEVMRLDNAGNVGIGTTTPTALRSTNLEVYNASGASVVVGTASTSISTLRLARKDATDGWDINYNFPVASMLSFNKLGTNAGPLFNIDSSGNVGIGVTPSAWGTTFKALQVGGGGTLSGSSTQANLSMNWVSTATGDKYIANGLASAYTQVSGQHLWYNAPSGTAGNAITFTQAMTLDASGNLLVGTTIASPVSGSGLKFLNDQDGAGNDRTSIVCASSTTAVPLAIYSTGAAAYRFFVEASGTINATSIVISAISDQRLKENVRDIDTGLDAIMALKPRRFDWKEGKGQDKKNAAGFIAQEFEDVFPECVGTSMAGEDGIEYKNINHETLIPTLVKAMQEQQAIIESLKARLDAANL